MRAKNQITLYWSMYIGEKYFDNMYNNSSTFLTIFLARYHENSANSAEFKNSGACYKSTNHFFLK